MVSYLMLSRIFIKIGQKLVQASATDESLAAVIKVDANQRLGLCFYDVFSICSFLWSLNIAVLCG